MANNKRKAKSHDANRDPISGEPGAHPVGVGIGAAAGTAAGTAAGVAAAAAAGAAAGTEAGPVGTAVGGIVGGVAAGVGGAFAGKAIAEAIDPTAEEAYWQENFSSRPYAGRKKFETYRPAYRYGVTSYTQNQGRSFSEAEPDLQQGWIKARGTSHMNWEDARPAVQDAYDRVCQRCQPCKGP